MYVSTHEQRRLRREHRAEPADQRARGQRRAARARREQLAREHVQRVDRARRAQLAHEEQAEPRARVRWEQHNSIIKSLPTRNGRNVAFRRGQNSLGWKDRTVGNCVAEKVVGVGNRSEKIDWRVINCCLGNCQAINCSAKTVLCCNVLCIQIVAVIGCPLFCPRVKPA